MPPISYDQIMATASESDKTLIPSSAQDSKPETILVATSPDQLDKAEHIKIEKLEADLGFQYTERLWAPKAFLEKTLSVRQIRGDRHYLINYSPTDANKHWKATINGYGTSEILHHHTGIPYGTFMLVNMGACGYGLMTTVPIKRFEFLFNYTGEFISERASASQDSFYKLSIKDALFGAKESVIINYDDALYAFRDNSVEKEGLVDARQYRNFSAFALHAPARNELGLKLKATNLNLRYIFETPEILDTVATENTTSLRGKAYIDGMSAHQFYASRDIAPYSLVFINYGSEYWSSQKIQPELFTPQGRVIEHKHYYPVYLYLININDPTRLLYMHTNQVFTALINKQGFGQLTYETLRSLTKEHLGEERFRAHFGCFLRKSPQVVLGYRKRRFVERVENNKDHMDNFKPRMQHFGFTFFGQDCSTPNDIDIKFSKPKLPQKGINSI